MLLLCTIPFFFFSFMLDLEATYVLCWGGVFLDGEQHRASCTTLFLKINLFAYLILLYFLKSLFLFM